MITNTESQKTRVTLVFRMITDTEEGTTRYDDIVTCRRSMSFGWDDWIG
jgi:hypothetical protein